MKHTDAVSPVGTTMPQPHARQLAERLTSASKEFKEIEALVKAYGTHRTPMNGATLYLALSRMIEALIDDPHLQARLIQHFEIELKSEFPATSGQLFSA